MANGSENERDVLLRLGFLEHPNANAAMEHLARRAEETQMRISKAVEATGSATLSQVNRIQQVVDKVRPEPQKNAVAGVNRIEVEQAKVRNEALGRLNKERIESARETAAVLDTIAEAEAIAYQEMATAVGAAVSQLRSDLDLLKSDDGSKGDRQDALNRVLISIGNITKAKKEAQEEAEKIAKEEAKAQVKAAKEAAAEQKRLIRELDAARKDANKSLLEEARSAARAEKERIAGLKSLNAAREKFNRDESRRLQQLEKDADRAAKKTAQEYLYAYSEVEKAATSAQRQIERGNQMLERGATGTADGISKVARASVLLGFASEGATEKALKRLALVQAAIDGVKGAYQVYKGVSDVLAGLSKVVLGKVAATEADVAASKLSEKATDSLTAAINRQTLSIRQNAQARAILNRVPVGGGSATGGGRGRSRGAGVASSGAAALISGGSVELAGSQVLVEALAESTAATKLQTRALAALESLKGIGSRLVSSVLGNNVIKTLLFDLKNFGSLFVRFGAAAGTLVLAAGAAAGGLLFAGKSAYEMGKEIKEAGFAGGAAVGSYTDKLASAEVAVLSWVGTVTGAFDLVGNAAVKEAEGRAALFDAEAAAREAHLNRIAAIEIEHALRIDSNNERFQERSFDLGQDVAKGDPAKLSNVQTEIRRLSSKLEDFSPELESQVAKLKDQESVLIGKVALGKQIGQDEKTIQAKEEALKGVRDQLAELESKDRARLEIQEKLASRQKEQLSLVAQIAADESRLLKEKADAIEQLISAKQREITKIEEAIEKEKRGIADIVKAKIEANKSAIQSAEGQFANLTDDEKRQFNDLLTQARNGKEKGFSREDIDLLSRVSTEETDKIAAAFNSREASRFGFDKFAGRGLRDESRQLGIDPTKLFNEDERARVDALKRNKEELATAEQELRRNAQEASSRFGQSEAEILERAKAAQDDQSINIVDETQLTIRIQENAELNRARIAETVRQTYALIRDDENERIRETAEQTYRQEREAEAARRKSEEAAGS